MASPFRYFRKHTKAFYAVASVIAIALFVFGRGTGGGGATRNSDQRHATEVVATWDGGSINEGQLRAYVEHRIITNQFLQMLFRQGGGLSGSDLPRTVPYFLIDTSKIDAVELETIDTEVFASLATQAGMNVSDGMINHYLEEFGLRRVDSDGIVAILGHLGRGNARSNEAIVFSTLRKLLLGYFYKQAYDDSSAVVMPEQRWEDWRRVNDRISLEVAKLPIEDFLDKVPEPTETQLKKLYDEFKEADPNLMISVGGRELPSPNPAFAVPRLVKLQYLLGSVAERTAKLLDTVTEAEIAEYYERNKRSDYTKTDLDNTDFDSAMPPAEGAPAGGTPGTGAAPEVTPTTPATGSEAPAAEGTAPAGTEGSTPPPADATPATGGATAPATEPAAPATGGAAPPAAPSGATPAPAAGNQGQSLPRRSPFHLTALQAATDAPAADAAATAPAAGTTAPSDTAAPATTDSAVPAATPAPGAEPATPAAPAAEGAKPGEDAKDAATDSTKAEEQVEYVPLDKVRDEIRELLARDKAVVQLQKEASDAFTKLLLDYNQYGRLVAQAEDPDQEAKEKKEVPPPPAKLRDLKWLADASGLSLVVTDPLTVRQLYELPLGKAKDEQGMPVVQAVFSTLQLFEPYLAKELEGDWYLVTKIEDSPRRVPTFEEVRDKVAAAWKRIEAGKLAENTAKELAEASEKGAESFETFFKDKGYEVIPQTALFSWRSFAVDPAMGYPPELSSIPELKNVGPDFMKAAFGLSDAKTVGLLNFDHSVAYVIRLHTRQYTPEKLKQYFLEEGNAWAGRRSMQGEHQRDFSQTINQRIWFELANFKFNEEWKKRHDERTAAKNN